MKKIIISLIIINLIVGGIILATKQTKEDKKLDSLEYIEKKGSLILGLDDSFPPMGFRNEKNEIVGFDIDVAKEVSKRLNVELILQPISWEAKEQELNTKNIDCIWNGMSVTDLRKEAMNLSDSYMKNKMVFVVKQDSQIKEQKDLNNKIVGLQSASSAQEQIEQNEIYNKIKEVIGYSNNITAFMDLEIGQIDAVLVDEVTANYYINSNSKTYKILDEAISEEEYAIGFRKQDSKLQNEVCNILKQMKKDGILEKISTQWFGKDVTIIK